MTRILPVVTLAIAACGGALLGHLNRAPLAAQEAICSFGSEQQCQEVVVCTERAWNIGFKDWSFGLGACLSWYKNTLYYRLQPLSGSPSGGNEDSEENDPGDDTEGNEEGGDEDSTA